MRYRLRTLLIYWARIALCGVIAGGVWTLLSVVLLALVGGDFLAAVRRDQQGAAKGMQLFLVIANVGAGTWAVWLYSAIRPHYGPGAQTAVIAGIAWWIIVSMQSAKWVMLLSVSSASALAPLAATTLVATVASTVVGAWFYEERASPASLNRP